MSSKAGSTPSRMSWSTLAGMRSKLQYFFGIFRMMFVSSFWLGGMNLSGEQTHVAVKNVSRCECPASGNVFCIFATFSRKNALKVSTSCWVELHTSSFDLLSP